MPIATLEEIRLLSNLETKQHKLLQIVLFGQPELDDNLRKTEIRQLRERITHSFSLAPLGAEEVREYLAFRLHAAGYRGPDSVPASRDPLHRPHHRRPHPPHQHRCGQGAACRFRREHSQRQPQACPGGSGRQRVQRRPAGSAQGLGAGSTRAHGRAGGAGRGRGPDRISAVPGRPAAARLGRAQRCRRGSGRNRPRASTRRSGARDAGAAAGTSASRCGAHECLRPPPSALRAP